jgi:hypothetical protein
MPKPPPTVGLQFDANTELIYAPRGASRLYSLSFIFNTQYVLEMMAHLVRDHVGLCEFSGCVVLSFECFEEAQIEVDFPILRAIEWSRDCLREAVVAGLARISHTKKCIGAPNQRKFFYEKDFPKIRGRPDDDRL